MARTATDQMLSTVRERREELRDAMTAAELALSAPVPGRVGAWWTGVEAALRDLAARFGEHVTLTEDPGGLFDDVIGAAPRVAHRVDRLRDEHVAIGGALDALVASRPPASVDDADRIRQAATDAVCRLARHRQHGADLLYEAYTVDVGPAD